MPMYPNHVTMTHPDHDGTWDCPTAYVATARKDGWKPVDDAAAGLYDPSDHTAAQVNAHLATVEDETERQRILDAERAGQNRTTITGD